MTRSHYSERKSALDFKDADAAAPRFGVIAMYIVFMSIFSNERQKVPPVNPQQKCLLNEIYGSFGMKSNYFGPVVHKKLKKF